MFESSVILYGSQTRPPMHRTMLMFESSVILYGSQTIMDNGHTCYVFESNVILYGSQVSRLRTNAGGVPDRSVIII